MLLTSYLSSGCGTEEQWQLHWNANDRAVAFTTWSLGGAICSVVREEL